MAAGSEAAWYVEVLTVGDSHSPRQFVDVYLIVRCMTLLKFSNATTLYIMERQRRIRDVGPAGIFNQELIPALTSSSL
jgi:hypothetical protein